MNEEGALAADDLVPRIIAEQLGERIPTRAILIIETMNAEGEGIRFFTARCQTWQALGMIRSIEVRLEHEDHAGWPNLDDD